MSFLQAAGTNAECDAMCWEKCCVKAVGVKSSRIDSEGWWQKLASVSAPFVSLLAPLCGTANLTTWLADKQLIDYGAAGGSIVYIVRPVYSLDTFVLRLDSGLCFTF